MTEILHSQLSEAINKNPKGGLPGVFLIHGQEMLVEQTVENLVTRLLDGASRDLCCEAIDGLAEKIPDALAQMNTFSMTAEPKIVIFKEAKLFEGRGSHDRLVEQIVEAFENEDFDLAAKSLVGLCGQLEIDPEDVLRTLPANIPLSGLHGQIGPEGIERLLRHAADQGWRAGGDNLVDTLQAAIGKGFADQHHLIITVKAKVPKNIKLYKFIRDHGWVIDCSVPTGERRADRMAQEAVLRQSLDTALAGAGKRVQDGLFEMLCQLTGFDLRTFVQNVEKLIDYSGERTEINTEDVNKVLRRTKSDPIFELTNALSDRNLNQALFYLQTLLEGGLYPLQILVALTNQVRRLMIAKDFAMSPQGKSWKAGMGYSQFQNTVMPAIASFDREIFEISNGWLPSADEPKKAKSSSAKTPQDISIAPNSNNPYPVYQTLSKSEKYTQQELLRAMALLNQTDLRLKSTGQDPAMVLKKTVMEICGTPNR